MFVVQETKAKRDAEEAAKEEENADAALEAETRAQEEFQKAELAMQQAQSEEEKRKAQEAKEKAEQEALKNKENRLRLSLRAAIKLRKRPKIDVTVVEAKEAEIPGEISLLIEVLENTYREVQLNTRFSRYVFSKYIFNPLRLESTKRAYTLK